ncbi:hypothetical protein HJG60_008995 [Phyllostomus discolor]|uniref:Uncharacterized protein n=1 Tax=Phyllostomus discolor TaxID=89673 RepID=A0A833YRY3_9CHIR|nr:hypothetical protein HJG60_008995 [Phyllostomus discolor]
MESGPWGVRRPQTLEPPSPISQLLAPQIGYLASRLRGGTLTFIFLILIPSQSVTSILLLSVQVEVVGEPKTQPCHPGRGHEIFAPRNVFDKDSACVLYLCQCASSTHLGTQTSLRGVFPLRY